MPRQWNGGKPWTPEDDKFLWESRTPHYRGYQLKHDWEPDYLDGDIEDLAEKLGRTPGGIKARLHKLFEEDKWQRTNILPRKQYYELLHLKEQWKKTSRETRLLFLKQIDRALIEEALRPEPVTLDAEAVPMPKLIARLQ